ncbi:uncharacterized protein LOC131693204 isoform X2 [Topomyia yanbarensis]|uniref:uncharacterized protein LOC131693204 isoform X2 n=1 Tax=Topomyia yanbarensis TaxID=2498891 RepID=UPI00273C5861|nr:uncharacterized protein LOC131693204 isoform X2 [Topomyia yanbarensis]
MIIVNKARRRREMASSAELQLASRKERYKLCVPPDPLQNAAMLKLGFLLLFIVGAGSATQPTTAAGIEKSANAGVGVTTATNSGTADIAGGGSEQLAVTAAPSDNGGVGTINYVNQNKNKETTEGIIVHSTLPSTTRIGSVTSNPTAAAYDSDFLGKSIAIIKSKPYLTAHFGKLIVS